MEVLYRYEDKKYAPPIDEFERPCGTGLIEVKLYSFRVTKVTKQGVWIDVWGQERFVLLSARKRFACPTIEEAMQSFKARKLAQIRIYTAKLRDAERALTLVNPTLQPIQVTDFKLGIIGSL